MLLKENKPLEMRFHARCRSFLKAFGSALPDGVRDMENVWWELDISLMSLLAFRQRTLADFQVDPFELVAQARRLGNAPDEKVSGRLRSSPQNPENLQSEHILHA